VAVYASANDETIVAREAGFEGVACVDDAARALELYCDLYRETGLEWVRAWCAGLSDFVLAMQEDDGRWINFIRDWDGTPNREGRTSIPSGASFWQARAMLALARSSGVVEDPRVDESLARGLAHLIEDPAPPDVRSLHILAALAMMRGGDHADLRPIVSEWCDELLACSNENVLMNSPMEEGPPHLWAHFEESALADASAVLARPDLLEVARKSADALYTNVIESGFDRSPISAFDVATTCDAMTRLAGASGDARYRELGALAREWFTGRNPARRAVYDRDKGRVADGIDDGRLNQNSGAESNIVAAQTMLSDVTTLARTLVPDQYGGPGR
jgi:hypothetical protein